MSHVEAIIHAFIRPNRRNRWLELLGSEHGRRKLRRHLSHCEDDLDERFVRRICDGEQSKDELVALLRAHGAGATCHALSENAELDGKELALPEALGLVVGRGMGTFLSIDPGRLAYFEGEDANARYLCFREG